MRYTFSKLTPDGHTVTKMFISGLIVKTFGHSWRHIKPAYDHQLSFQTPADKYFRKTLQRFILVLNSYVHFAHRNAIVREYCQVVSSSSLRRVIIDAFDIFPLIKTMRRKQEAVRFLRKATRLREALAMPLMGIVLKYMTLRWHYCVDKEQLPKLQPRLFTIQFL